MVLHGTKREILHGRLSLSVIVYVCVFVPFIGGSPSVQGETCATLCSVSRGLHLFSVFFCPTRTNRGHIGGGKHGDFLILLCFLYAPPSSCGACLHLLSREGFGRSYPSSTTKSNFACSRSFSALPGTKVRKKPLSPRLGPVTWLPEG